MLQVLQNACSLAQRLAIAEKNLGKGKVQQAFARVVHSVLKTSAAAHSLRNSRS